MPFRPLTERTLRWAPIEDEGLEHLTLQALGDVIVADSVVIGGRSGQRYGVHFRLVCDAAWRVRALDLETTSNRTLNLVSDGQGHWRDNAGVPLPAFDECIDVDLAGTPFTNTLPIRRLALRPERGRVEIAVLYVPFGDFVPLVDHQAYSCLEWGRLYRYEAMDRTFTADLSVDEDGLVLDYPTLFRRLTRVGP